MHTTRLLLVLFVLAVAITSCSRTMTPFEAANHGKMKRCKTLR